MLFSKSGIISNNCTDNCVLFPSLIFKYFEKLWKTIFYWDNLNTPAILCLEKDECPCMDKVEIRFEFTDFLSNLT